GLLVLVLLLLFALLLLVLLFLLLAVLLLLLLLLVLVLPTGVLLLLLLLPLLVEQGLDDLAVVQGVGVLRFLRQRLVVGLQRFLEALQVGQGIAPIIVRLGIVLKRQVLHGTFVIAVAVVGGGAPALVAEQRGGAAVLLFVEAGTGALI